MGALPARTTRRSDRGGSGAVPGIVATDKLWHTHTHTHTPPWRTHTPHEQKDCIRSQASAEIAPRFLFQDTGVRQPKLYLVFARVACKLVVGSGPFNCAFHGFGRRAERFDKIEVSRGDLCARRGDRVDSGDSTVFNIQPGGCVLKRFASLHSPRNARCPIASTHCPHANIWPRQHTVCPLTEPSFSTKSSVTAEIECIGGAKHIVSSCFFSACLCGQTETRIRDAN